MPSTGKGNGTLFVLSINDTVVAHSTNTSMSVNQNLRDITTKGSGGWEEVAAALRSGEFSGDFYFAEDANISFDDIFAHITNRAPLELTYGTTVSGDKKYSCVVYVQSLERTDPVEETSTYTVSLKASGPITSATTT